jgi:hypothetical protein
MKNTTMKDLTDYIIKDGTNFYVDVYDVESGEPVFEDGEEFTFSYEGKEYVGSAVDEDGDDVALVEIA